MYLCRRKAFRGFPPVFCSPPTKTKEDMNDMSSYCSYKSLNSVNIPSDTCPFAHWSSIFSKEWILTASIFIYYIINQDNTPKFYICYFRSKKTKNR